jgi:hypothetical protein
MSDIDEVMERLVADPTFRRQLHEDPAAALSGYDLGREDLEILAASFEDDAGGEHSVEQRTSKAAIIGFVVSLSEGGLLGADGLAATDHAEPPQPGSTVVQQYRQHELITPDVALEELAITNEGFEPGEPEGGLPGSSSASSAGLRTADAGDDVSESSGGWWNSRVSIVNVGSSVETPDPAVDDLLAPEEGTPAGAVGHDSAMNSVSNMKVSTAEEDMQTSAVGDDVREEAPGLPVITGRVPNPTDGPAPEATVVPPSDELAAPPDEGDASMTKSELIDQMPRRPVESDTPVAWTAVGHEPPVDDPDALGRVKVEFPAEATEEADAVTTDDEVMYGQLRRAGGADEDDLVEPDAPPEGE